MYAETADGLLHSTFLKLCLLGANSLFKQRLFFYDFVLCQDLSVSRFVLKISGLDLAVWYFSIPSALHEIPFVCLWKIFLWLGLILFEVLSEDCSFV